MPWGCRSTERSSGIPANPAVVLAVEAAKCRTRVVPVWSRRVVPIDNYRVTIGAPVCASVAHACLITGNVWRQIVVEAVASVAVAEHPRVDAQALSAACFHELANTVSFALDRCADQGHPLTERQRATDLS
jgi:hypothetical protein